MLTKVALRKFSLRFFWQAFFKNPTTELLFPKYCLFLFHFDFFVLVQLSFQGEFTRLVFIISKMFRF